MIAVFRAAFAPSSVTALRSVERLWRGKKNKQSFFSWKRLNLPKIG
jgi:hypothetical protein